MNQLQAYAQDQPSWPLEEFVSVVNSHLPEILPEEKTNSRVKGEITARLVRHYTTINILEEPMKVGREARYTYRHLLQVLLLRRVLAEGHSVGSIDQLIASSSNAELEAMLQGGVQLTAAPDNVALAHLQRLQQRQELTAGSIAEMAMGAAQQANAQRLPYQWIRLNIMPGLEVHVREDFRYPNHLQAQAALLEAIALQLAAFGESEQQTQ